MLNVDCTQSSLLFTLGSNNTWQNNIFDLGSSGGQTIIKYQSWTNAPMSNNNFKNNIVIIPKT